MRFRIGNRTRKAAIHCLEQCASDRIGHVANTCTCDVYAPHETAGDVAAGAWAAVCGRVDTTMDIIYLEAAALLRDGWDPGDPVEVRR